MCLSFHSVLYVYIWCINFRVDTVVPSKTIRCFPRNKPWVTKDIKTKDIKTTLKQKKRAFRSDGNLKLVQREFKIKLARGKDC